MADYDLKALRAVADLACDEAVWRHANIPGAVNWGDLSCVSAERFENDDGGVGYRVRVEEAAPASWQLEQFIEKYLEEHGFPGVSVETD